MSPALRADVGHQFKPTPPVKRDLAANEVKAIEADRQHRVNHAAEGFGVGRGLRRDTAVAAVQAVEIAERGVLEDHAAKVLQRVPL